MTILYHGTSHTFDEIDFSMLGAVDGAPANCRMGFWVSPDLELAQKFGTTVLVLDASEVVFADFPIREMTRMHSLSFVDGDGGAERHAAYVSAHRDRGTQVLRVIESDGTWRTAIVIDPDAVRIVDRMTAPAPSTPRP